MPTQALRAAALLATLAAGGATAAAAQNPIAGYTVHIAATHWLGERSHAAHHWFKPLRDGVLQGLVFKETADGALPAGLRKVLLATHMAPGER